MTIIAFIVVYLQQEFVLFCAIVVAADVALNKQGRSSQLITDYSAPICLNSKKLQQISQQKIL